MSRIMLRVCRNENSISFRTHSKKRYEADKANNDRMGYKNFQARSGSSTFYIPKKQIENLFDNGYVVCKDIHSFCTLQIDENWLLGKKQIIIDFSWLDSNGKKLSGELESLTVDYNQFFYWYYSDLAELKLINQIENITPKIEFWGRGNETLKSILDNKILKQKFIKAIMPFQLKRATSIHFGYDHVEYSFSWSAFVGEQFDYNGGLIFHRDYSERENLVKGRYGVHT